MSSWDDDEPFVLDDEFVNAATISELDHESRAREGERARRVAEAEEKAAKAANAPKRSDRSSRRNAGARPIVDGDVPGARGPLVAAIGAVAVFVALVAFVVRGPYGEESRPPGTLPDGVTTTVGLTGRSYQFGECVTWEQGGASLGERDTKVVSCDAPHLIEVSEAVILGDRFDQYPSEAQWDAVMTEDCRGPNEQLVGGAIEPSSRFRTVILKPQVESWIRNTDRRAWCAVGLSQMGADGTAPPGAENLIENTGRASSDP